MAASLDRPILTTPAVSSGSRCTRGWRCTPFSTRRATGSGSASRITRGVSVYAASRRSSTPSYDYGYDLYELLGVEKGATQQEIRRSYRWLQKKCHPDIAGSVGHDMSILLNQAYTVLADPNGRAAYDQTVFDASDLEGYTGCPLYSKWFGPTHEERAVFVDENRCVGCLKCALIAPNTFAIENRYGRARAVGQWADPKPVIEDAVKACPVDCISWVDKNQLAAFEFVMSKVPRLPVGCDVNGSGGLKDINVYMAVETLLKKLKQRDLANATNLKESPAQRDARLAAAEEVQVRAGRWWYHFMGKQGWKDQESNGHKREAHGAIVPLVYYRNTRTLNFSEGFAPANEDNDEVSHSHDHDSNAFGGELRQLYEAASQRRSHGQKYGTGGSPSPAAAAGDEYWVPIDPLSCPVSYDSTSQVSTLSGPTANNGQTTKSKVAPTKEVDTWERVVSIVVPGLSSGIAGLSVAFTSGVESLQNLQGSTGYGPLPSEWTESREMQILLALAVWYVAGLTLAKCGMIGGKMLVSKIRTKNK